MKRISLILSAEVSDRIETLQRWTDANEAEVIARALAVYEALWEVKRQGATITITSKDGKKRDLFLL